MTTKEILARIEEYESSKIYKDMQMYREYYEARNPELMAKVADRDRRRKKPNWAIPTPYYATVIDTMSGFLFSDIQYSSTEEYQEVLHDLLDKNHIETKDMRTGTYALAYNRAYELVYTSGEPAQIKLASLDPLTIIPIYDDTIEHELVAVLWKRVSNGKTFIDYIDKNVWQYYEEKDDKLIVREPEKRLYFSHCPVVEFKSELIGDSPPFSVVISYIAALDWAITGNSNEIDRLVDALLILSQQVKQEDLDRMPEWQALTGITKDDVIPQYIEKQLSPEFRKYVTDLLIKEIHKHSHVVDWFSESQLGEASAKALKTRLFDMDMFSKRIEKIYRIGIEQRINLLGELLQYINKITPEKVTVTFSRTVPSDRDELINTLKGVDFLSNETKIELVGLDVEQEKERLEREAPSINLDDFIPRTVDE